MEFTANNNLVNDNLFTDLTEEETSTLNGGRYCYYVWVPRCYISWGRRICQYIRVIYCR